MIRSIQWSVILTFGVQFLNNVTIEGNTIYGLLNFYKLIKKKIGEALFEISSLTGTEMNIDLSNAEVSYYTSECGLITNKATFKIKNNIGQNDSCIFFINLFSQL